MKKKDPAIFFVFTLMIGLLVVIKWALIFNSRFLANYCFDFDCKKNLCENKFEFLDQE